MVKENITPLTSALENVLLVSGVNYDWKTDEFPEQAFSENRQIGFIAQEMEKVYPELVTSDSEGYKRLDYSRATPILWEAIKEQQGIIEENQRTIQQVEEKLNRLEALLIK